MGWVYIRDIKTGKEEFYGDSPVELKPLPPKDDPLHGMVEAANRNRLLKAIGEIE